MAKQFWPFLRFVSPHFNTVTWHSIQLSTHPVGFNDGTSRNYDDNDVIFCPKIMSKHFWPTIPFCATVFTLSYDLALNFPQTQLVAMVAQAVGMATKTINFCKNNGQAILTPLPPGVTVSTPLHDSASNSPHTHSVAMVAQAVVMARMTSYFVRKTVSKLFWLLSLRCATVSTLSHDSASKSPQGQWISMVSQAVVMPTMTLYFVQKQ